MTLSAVARLALGTVQFGMPYGVSNAGGQVADDEVAAILHAADAAGIDMLDTAAAYGEAEQVVARATVRIDARFHVLSKTLPGVNLDTVIAAARRSAELAGGALDAILVHHPCDLATQFGDQLWQVLLELSGEGLARRIGISASYDDRPLDLAARFAPAVMQLPVSLFDQRLVQDGTLAELTTRGVEIHARSIFLQGLLFADESRLAPSIRHIGPALDARRKLIYADGASPVEAALSYVLAQPEIRRVIIGLTSVRELNDVLAATARPCDLPWANLAIDDATVLNPSRWGTS